MMKHLTFTVFILLVCTLAIQAQEIDFKKGTVFLDGKAVLSYKVENRATEFTLYKLNTNEEVAFIIDYENQTVGYRKDDYYKINFISIGLKLESSNILGTWKKVVKWFFKNDLFNNNAELNKDKVKVFVEKYDENISQRTIKG